MTARLDHAKHLRLKTDLAAMRAQVHGLTQYRQSLRDELFDVRLHVIRSPITQTGVKTCKDVLALPSDDLERNRVDMASCRRGAALEDAIVDAQGRIDAAQTELTPLAKLVEAIDRYVETNP